MMKAGFARSDITPRLGVQLAGYGPYRNRAAMEIVAPLNARVMLLEKGRTRVVVVSLELCGLPRELDRRIRGAVAAAAKCQPDAVFLSVTHTHSAPAVGGMAGWGEADAMYVETLPTRVVAAVIAARANLGRVEWSAAEVPCEGIAVNRETDAGFALNADLGARLKPSWRPKHPEQTDPVVRVLAAKKDGKIVGVLHHFACHPVVYGEKTNAIHGDFVGEASSRIEAAHPGVVALFLPGALGDINPKLNHRTPRESKRALAAISRMYAAAIEGGLKGLAPLADDALAVDRREVRFTRKAWSKPEIEWRIKKLETRLSRIGVTDWPHGGSDSPLHTDGMELARLQGLRQILATCRGDRTPNPPVGLHVLRLGEIVLLGCGLELYHELGQKVLAELKVNNVWLVSLVGGMGYAPDAAAQRRAGYAGDFVPLISGELPFEKIDQELPGALVNMARRVIA